MSSSPIAYPPSSSPAEESPNKRRKLDNSRHPLAQIVGNERSTTVAGFVDNDSDEENELAEVKATLVKRKHPQPKHDTTVPTTFFDTKEEIAVIQRTENSEFSLDDESQAPDLYSVKDNVQQGSKKPITIRTSSGLSRYIEKRCAATRRSYEQVVADRSAVVEGRARKSYYGINIHELLDEETQGSTASREITNPDQARPSIERPVSAHGKPKRTLMWSEKYRARKFTDLIGDERTHRSVLRWLKAWDPIVFSGSVRPKRQPSKGRKDVDEDRLHRKVLLLAGPPGLGKTTLAHVCARQAGYEVSEINASDERSRNVVKDRIQTMVGTENVRSLGARVSDGKASKVARPLCVVVDEVDGVVTGNSEGGGEGGFIKALVDLIQLDQKNCQRKSTTNSLTGPRRKRKGDDFYLQRPLILVCNDVYHPSLRPIRQSGVAEIIHVRKPPLSMVISRTQSIFEKEGIPCDGDAARRLCEATWGVSSRRESGSGSGPGEGDIRGIMVISEWVATKLRTSYRAAVSETRLTRSWIDEHVLNGLSQDGALARGLGRGSAKELVDRIFLEGGGFPKTAPLIEVKLTAKDSSGTTGVAEAARKRVMDRLRKMIDSSGDADKVMTDCFTSYLTAPFQDDTFLSKPTALYEWLHFHDSISSAVYSSQEWELQSYISSSILAFHHLFASSTRQSTWNGSSNKIKTATNTNDDDGTAQDETTHPFSSSGAPYAATEAYRETNELLSTIRSSLSLSLARLFRSHEFLATELAPYLTRMLAPHINPVIIKTAGATAAADKSGSTATIASVRRAAEKECVARAVNAMSATGVRFMQNRLGSDDATTAVGSGISGRAHSGWVFRMEPAIDVLAAYATGGKAMTEHAGGVRYAVRQVLDAEWNREEKRAEERQRAARWAAGGKGGTVEDEEMPEQVTATKEQEREKETGKGKGKASGLKRDFFGRLVSDARPLSSDGDAANGRSAKRLKRESVGGGAERIWVSFHEGFSNAVRKPITIKELMGGL